jgi:hypothetical protein
MLKLRTLVMFVAATITVIEGPVPSGAQSAPAGNQPDSVSIHVSLQKSSYAIGEKPIVVMTVKNISSKEIWFSTDPYQVRFHVTNKDGVPQKTELHRHLLGDYRPGDGPMLLRGPLAGRSIAPGVLDAQKYNLSAYYDLNVPGDYSVYLEIYDPSGPVDGSGHWVRTDIAHFKIEAPAP